MGLKAHNNMNVYISIITDKQLSPFQISVILKKIADILIFKIAFNLQRHQPSTRSSCRILLSRLVRRSTTPSRSRPLPGQQPAGPSTASQSNQETELTSRLSPSRPSSRFHSRCVLTQADISSRWKTTWAPAPPQPPSLCWTGRHHPRARCWSVR